MKKGSRVHLAVSVMHPLRHVQGDGSFDAMQSEVAEWLTSRPEVRAWLVSTFRSNGFIRYDQENKWWVGVPYVPAKNPDTEIEEAIFMALAGTTEEKSLRLADVHLLVLETVKISNQDLFAHLKKMAAAGRITRLMPDGIPTSYCLLGSEVEI